MFEEPLFPLQPSFAHGEVSPFLFGRVDLAAYTSGLRTSRNAVIRTEGSWSNRGGFQYVGNSTSSIPKSTILMPFTFSVGQSYEIEVGTGATGIQVFSMGSPVGAPLSSPYLVSELAALRWAQSADTLTVTHVNHPQYEFKRTSATTFTFLPVVINNGPFIPVNTDGTTLVYATGISGIVNLVASTPIFAAGHVGGLFYLAQQDVSPIPPWEPLKTLVSPGTTTNAVPPVGVLCSSNGKNYKCVAGVPSGSAQYSTGQVAPSHTVGVVWDGNGGPVNGVTYSCGVAWEFQDFGFGVVRITGGLSGTTAVIAGVTYYSQCSAVVQPVIAGQPSILPSTVVGPRSITGGPFTFTGDGSTTTFSPVSGGSPDVDPTKWFVTIGGIWQQPTNYAIIGTSIQFLAAPANGAAISVSALATGSGLYATTFWAFGAFSPLQGYPSTVTYFPDRIVYAGTNLQPTGVFGSQTSDYHNFTVSSPVVNSDAFTVFLNARQLNTISDLVPLQDLIVGTANIVWRLWPGQTGTALGPLSISANPQAFVGESPSSAAVLYGDSMIYAIYGGRRIRDLIYQFQFDKYLGQELTAFSRHLIPFGTKIIRMVYAPEPFGQLFALRSDGMLLVCTYVREQQMIAWCRWDTKGTFDDIALVPESENYTLYALINRTILGKNSRNVERLTSWEVLTNLDYKLMDCSITYDGRNTSLTQMQLTGGTTWISGDVGTLTASSSIGWQNFATTDPALGNAVQLFDVAGNLARVLITGFISATQASVRFIDPIPADLQGASTTTWTFARTTFSGATQLAGQAVAVYADGCALAGSGGNPSFTVSSAGTIVMPNPIGVLTIGLQYLSDFETLHMNQQGIQTIRERSKAENRLHLDVTGTNGLIAGTDFINMTPIKERFGEPYLQPTAQQEGIISAVLYTEFDSECHTCVRQPYPLPATIRMVIPEVGVGEPVG